MGYMESLHRSDYERYLDNEIEKTSSRTEEPHLKSLCWICLSSKVAFMNRATKEI